MGRIFDPHINTYHIITDNNDVLSKVGIKDMSKFRYLEIVDHNFISNIIQMITIKTFFSLIVKLATILSILIIIFDMPDTLNIEYITSITKIVLLQF